VQQQVPRLRVFAGPNGSGKSTIKDRVPPHLIYTYVNADELQKEAVATGAVDLTPFGITTTTEDIQAFFGAHGLCAMAGFADHLHEISFDGTGVRFGNKVNAYHASVVADFIRQQLLAKRESFTFETVMSSRDKVDFMRQAQEQGYRTYLYFVATEDPSININRVANRVKDGGHNVPERKIVERYWRSLELLPQAILVSNRAFLFDNSGERSVLEVEITDAEQAEFKVDDVHDWCMSTLYALVDQPKP
jgi:predicted ABC-type ATPase